MPAQAEPAPATQVPAPDATPAPGPAAAPETSATPKPEPTQPHGPLSTLAQKAADTQLGRKASQKIPESARPTLDRASRVLNTVDDHLLAAKGTLDTDEGRRVVSTGRDFAVSLAAFAAMLFTTTLASAERKLELDAGDQATPRRFVNVCRSAADRLKSRAERREREVDGTCEAWMYAHARKGLELAFSIFRSVLKALSTFGGPGKEYVVPAAEKAIDALPEDLQKAVRDSQGPVASIRGGLGLAQDSDSSEISSEREPEESRPEAERGTNTN